VGTVIGYIVALAVVGGVLFLVASYAFGRGEEMAPVLPEGTPVELPDDRLADGDDLRALRLSVALRGYRMDEVDWLLDRLSEQVDTRDREIARLRSVLHVEPVPAEDEPELLTHPFPRVVDSAAAERTPVPDEEPYGPGRTGNGAHAAPAGGDDRFAEDGRTGPRPVPDELSGDTGARPDQPARQVRTHDQAESE
jgi:DivIVA domain-containing protein